MKWKNFYYQEDSVKDFVWQIFVHSEFLESILNERPKKILEIGSGLARLSIFLSYFDLEVISIDNDMDVLSNACKNNKKFNGKVNFIRQDAFNLGFKDDSFDIAFSQGFLEHFDDEKAIKLIEEQLRVAKIVIFSVPNNYYPNKDFGNERRLSKEKWDDILKDFLLIESKNYYKKRYIKNFYRKKTIMYLATVRK